jgi:hypothetical protein
MGWLLCRREREREREREVESGRGRQEQEAVMGLFRFARPCFAGRTAFSLRVGEGIVRYKGRDEGNDFTYLLLGLYACACFCSKDAFFIVEQETVSC